MRLAGRATHDGTKRYAARFPSLLRAGHYRDLHTLAASSIGLGTYLGPEDSVTDTAYVEAIRLALLAGCNVIDSAINYRCQRSERNVGAALAGLVRDGSVARDEVILATKGGFIPFDGSLPADPDEYFRQTYIETEVAAPDEVVAGCHVLTPRYIRDQLRRSLENLGVETVDIYYVHNPETQLTEVPREEFIRRLKSVFECLESEAEAGRIQYYGAATWDGFRNAPEAPDHLMLEDLVELAQSIAGDRHRFRVVQLPYNLAMTEALTRPTQTHNGQPMPLLSLPGRLGTYVMSSASILQGRLASDLPEAIASRLTGLTTDAQRALQFARSSPGLGTALVGMKDARHVRENLEVAGVHPIAGTEIRALFRRA